MAVEDDQTKWRTVFCKDPTFMKITTYPEADEPHTVVQADPAELKMTNTPDGVTAQEVTQLDSTKLTVQVNPGTEGPIHVRQDANVKGIWPPANATRYWPSGIAAGVQKVIMYTVPLGKKFYITSSYLSSWENADAESFIRLHVENDASAIKYFLTFHYYAKAGQLASGERYLPALEAFQTDKVVLQSYHANLYGRGKCEGWLEDV